MKYQPAYDYMGYGVYAFGQTSSPSIEELLQNLPSFIGDVGGIQVLDISAQGVAISTLDQMTFTPRSQGQATITGTASVVLGGGTQGPWASDHLKDGYAILVSKSSLQTLNPNVVMTTDPQVIANDAGPGMPFVVVAAPTPLLTAAQEALGPAISVPPVVIPAPAPLPAPPPEGSALPPPPAPAPAPQQAGMLSKYMVPIAIGGVALTAVILMARRR
jgi:hypothetical protein